MTPLGLHVSVILTVCLFGASLQGQKPVEAPAPAPAAAPTGPLTIDYVFLIDVSGSMAGEGTGHTNIFPDVITTISNFVGELGPGSRVYVVPFSSTIRQVKEFAIHDEADKRSIISYLDGLVANGDRTAVFDSIRFTLDLIKRRRTQPAEADRAVVLHVYTDGDDNVSRRLTLADILDHFKLVRGDYDWLFYTELGLPRSAEKQATFRGRDRVMYVSENVGQVRPIIQVEPLLRFVDYGNIVEGQWPTRVVKFAVRSSQALPPKLTMTVEPQFETLRNAGVLAEVTPSQFPVDGKEKSLQLKWSNPLTKGKYTGKLKFTTNDPLVLVIPDELGATFSHAVPSVIRVTPAPGEQFPIVFGELIPGARAVRHLRLDFNQEALDTDAKVDVRLRDDSGARGLAGVGSIIYVDGARGKKQVQLDESTRELALVLAAPNKLKPGTYSGTIELASPTASVSYDGAAQPDMEAVSIDWRYTIVPGPLPWWTWLLLAIAVIAAIAIFIRAMTRPKKFTDLRLQILEPKSGSVDLTGLHSKTFGPSSQELKDAAADFTVRAVKKGTRTAAVLETDGQIQIARRSSKVDVYGSEELFVSDVIEVAPYRLRVESFALGTEDQS